MSRNGDGAQPGLPRGWVLAELGSLLAEPLGNGVSVKGSDQPPGLAALRLNAMGEQGFDYRVVRWIPSGTPRTDGLRVVAGDFFVSRGNGSIHLVGRGTLAQEPPFDVIFPDTMIRVRLVEPIRSTRWLPRIWCGWHVRRQIEAKAKTTAGIWKISQRDLASIVLPLPPLAEQRRIVAEIEKQFSRLDAGVAALKRVQANLKRYRAAVLQAACEGRLVPTEAELARAEGRGRETGAELLERLLEGRKTEWQSVERRARRYEPPPQGNNGAERIPEGWCLASLEQITSAVRVICYGILMPKENVESGVPYVKVKDMKGDRIDVGALHRTTPEIAAAFARASLKPGDLLLSIRGTYGRVAEVPPELDGANITQDTARLAVSPSVDRRFVALVLRAPAIQRYFQRVARGVAVKGVNIADVRLTPIPLPPLAEQERIVAEVERRLSVVDDIEGAVRANLKRAERLRQSILKRAFEGKLVPQDPDEEGLTPASGHPSPSEMERGSSAESGANGRRGGRRAMGKTPAYPPASPLPSRKGGEPRPVAERSSAGLEASPPGVDALDAAAGLQPALDLE